MFTALVNGKKMEVQSTEMGWTVDGKELNWDLQKVSEGRFHIFLNGKSYRAEVVKVDRPAKTAELKINGKRFTIEVKDRFDLLLEQMGMNGSGTGIPNATKAPMPGLIIDLKVKTGDSVKTGDPLLVLEAMKMENIIKAQGEGTITSVKIKKGDNVEKGQVLIEFAS